MNRQNALILFGVAWISAAALTWFLYAKIRVPKAEKTEKVLAAAREMPMGTLVKKADLKQIDVLERNKPKGALLQENEALGRVLLYPVTVNEPLTASKLSTSEGVEGVPSTIEPGYRAVSVPISDTSGGVGLIQPNSRVDVLFTKPGTMAEAVTTTILQDVKVLAMGRATQPGQPIDPRAPRAPVATLVVTPEQAQKLELAKNQGKISLALRNPLDRSATPTDNPVYTEVLDPTGDARVARARRARAAADLARKKAPNLEDPREWKALTGESKSDSQPAPKKKEPEKPGVVVDVYRGDKHVQEIFR
jgi:pilus assembly protein CpaB